MSGKSPAREPPTATAFGRAWRSLRDFAALGADTSYLWPRWLVLRAVGLVYMVIFAGIIVESRAMIGPHGVAPLGTYLAEIRQLFPARLDAFLGAPSLFWLNDSAGMVVTLEWVGFLAAAAVVLNLWPRVSLALCWLVFLSFVTTWADFSSAQLDRLMLETALLCVPFAPRGLRPGLGADSPPRPIAVLAMRWLLVRVMLESGLVKLVSSDPHWRNLTAMDVMYETAPSPTILGYWAHQLPHWFHVGEIALTFAAELLAPLAAMFGGRRGRWLALALWTGLQAGIQLTCNFGWLNTAALGLGLLLLDDQMIATAAGKIRRVAGRPAASPADVPPRPLPPAPWKLYGLRAALGVQFALTLYYFADVCGLPVADAPAFVTAVVKPFVEFRSANGYFLYAYFEPSHRQIDFEGSNDGGRTWRTYEYRHLPQRVDRVAAFLAPWFPRFEATIQIEGWRPGPYSLLPLVATQLLRRNPDVLGRFARDPFPDRRPTVIRLRRYRLAFTDPATLRRTGSYWRKEFDGDFFPAMYRTATGAVAAFDLTGADADLAAGKYEAARATCERQFQLGNLDAGYRLAEIYSRGLGVPADPAKTVELFTDLAGRGEIRARHNLGLCYEYGIGVPVDYARAADQYRQAAARGSLLSIYALGTLAANDHLAPRDDVEGLAMLWRAEAATDGEPALLAQIRRESPALVQRLEARMSAAQVAQSRERAAHER